MLTPREQAEVDLARWQALRAIDMTPQQRIERLFEDFFKPPIELDTRYQDQLNAVAKEMEIP